MHTKDILAEHHRLIEQWNHLPGYLHVQISGDMRNGFDRIVPFKDGPFDRWALSDGESESFYSGDDAPDFNALMEAAVASYAASHGGIGPHERIFLPDEMKAAQQSVRNAVEMDIVDWLRKNESPEVKARFMESPKGHAWEDAELRASVVHAVERVLDAYDVADERVGMHEANVILCNEKDRCRIAERFRYELLITDSPALDYSEGSILFVRNAKGSVDIYQVDGVEETFYVDRLEVSVTDARGESSVFSDFPGSEFGKSVIGVAEGLPETEHAVPNPDVKISPVLFLVNGVTSTPPEGVRPEAYAVSFNGVCHGYFRHPDLAGAYAKILTAQIENGGKDTSDVDMKAWARFIDDTFDDVFDASPMDNPGMRKNPVMEDKTTRSSSAYSMDVENVTKAAQTANLLVSDLRGVVSSRNPFLGDAALDLLKTVVEVEKQLKRLCLSAEQLAQDTEVRFAGSPPTVIDDERPRTYPEYKY